MAFGEKSHAQQRTALSHYLYDGHPGAFAGRRLDDNGSFLEMVLNNMTQGVILFDAHERVLVCNNRYVEMYGLASDVVKPGCSGQ